jgi:hypothetical protein
MSDEIIITRNNLSKESVPQTSYPTETVDLPSGGKFYESSNPLSKGSVEMKFMTAKEEDILTSPNLLKKGLAIDKLLESLIVDRSVNLDSMLSGDKNALIFAARRLAYGDTYGPLDIQCPKCNTKNKVNVDLSQIQNKEFNLDGVLTENNEFTYTLPTSKAVVTFRPLTANDEKSIERDNLAMTKIKKDSSNEVTSRLKYMITSINGERDKVKLKTIIENLLAKDSLALRQYVKSVTPDIDSSFNFVCEQCTHEERVAVPITAQFFWPDSGV